MLMESIPAVVGSVGVDTLGTRTARIELINDRDLQPGQPLLAFPVHEPSGALRTTLYPSELTASGFRCSVPGSPRWEPGDRLDMWGPLGSGFGPPKRARRWLLMALESGLEVLFPLLERGLAAGTSISVLGSPARALPPEIEVIQEPQEALAWSDYLALAVGRSAISNIRPSLSLDPGLQPGCPAEILIVDEFPCGIGACGACPVRVSAGWRWACTDGPVFSFDDLQI